MNHYNDPYDDPKKPIEHLGIDDHDLPGEENRHAQSPEDDLLVDMTDLDLFNP